MTARPAFTPEELPEDEDWGGPALGVTVSARRAYGRLVSCVLLVVALGLALQWGRPVFERFGLLPEAQSYVALALAEPNVAPLMGAGGSLSAKFEVMNHRARRFRGTWWARWDVGDSHRYLGSGPVAVPAGKSSIVDAHLSVPGSSGPGTLFLGVIGSGDAPLSIHVGTPEIP